MAQFACFAGSAMAQETADTFEVADVKIHSRGEVTELGTVLPRLDTVYALSVLRHTMKNGQVMLHDVPLNMLIELAWNVVDSDFSGPSWANDVRLDVIAKASYPMVSEDELCLMLRSLLQERMGLTVHTEQRERPVYILTVAKGGPKLTATDSPGNTDQDRCTLTRIGEFAQGVSCPHETMSAFTRDLPGMASKYVDRMVVNETGLDGAWTFSLGWTPLAMVQTDGGTTMYAALESQLGLKLTPARRSMPVLTVDRLLREPTGN